MKGDYHYISSGLKSQLQYAGEQSSHMEKQLCIAL